MNLIENSQMDSQRFHFQNTSYISRTTKSITLSTYTENIFQTAKTEEPLFYADHSLETKSSGTCDLLIIVEKKVVQLALKERRSGRLLAVEIMPGNKQKDGWKQELENITAHSRLLRNYEFSKVTAGISSNEYTLVPDALFRKGDENIYFRKNFPSGTDNNIHAEFIPSFHLYTVFSIDRELESELNHLFQDPKLWHFSQAILTGLSLQMKTDIGHQMLLNIHDNSIDIVVTENKKLILMNTFSWQTNEDILYYTLFICEQLELNPEKIPLTVTGEIDADSALYTFLYKYIRTIVFPEKPSSLLNIFNDSGLPFHKYSTLYSFSLCE